MKRKWTYELVKEYIESLGYILVSKVYINAHVKLAAIDTIGYYYYTTIDIFLNNKNPEKFHPSNPYTIQNIKLWCKLNDKPFELISNKYEGCNKYLKWKCLKEKCGEIFEMNWNSIFSQGNGCGVCNSRQVRLSNCLATKNPELAKEWHPIKNEDLTPYNVAQYSNKKVWWQCINNPKHEWKTAISHRSNKRNCPYCSGRLPSEDYNLLTEYPELCEEWNYNKNNKKPEDYCPNSNQKVWWICKECSHEWKTKIANRNSLNKTGCPECSESHGETNIKLWLKQNNFIYDKQYTYNDLIGVGGGLLKFDVPVFWDDEKTKLRILIEFDGIQHTIWQKDWQTKKSFDTLQIHDKLKNEYCKNNNIKLLRINYKQFHNIDKILSEELNFNNVN